MIRVSALFKKRLSGTHSKALDQTVKAVKKLLGTFFEPLMHTVLAVLQLTQAARAKVTAVFVPILNPIKYGAALMCAGIIKAWAVIVALLARVAPRIKFLCATLRKYGKCLAINLAMNCLFCELVGRHILYWYDGHAKVTVSLGNGPFSLFSGIKLHPIESCYAEEPELKAAASTISVPAITSIIFVVGLLSLLGLLGYFRRRH